jgi:hypothetical protein
MKALVYRGAGQRGRESASDEAGALRRVSMNHCLWCGAPHGPCH